MVHTPRMYAGSGSAWRSPRPITWYSDRVTAPATASTAPVSDDALPVQSPAAIKPAPASASAVAATTTGATGSCRNTRVNASVNRGAVLTSRTDAATEV